MRVCVFCVWVECNCRIEYVHIFTPINFVCVFREGHGVLLGVWIDVCVGVCMSGSGLMFERVSEWLTGLMFDWVCCSLYGSLFACSW